MRKNAGLTPHDRIALSVDADGEMRRILEKYASVVQEAVLADSIVFESTAGERVDISEAAVTVSISKR
jgi:hypothetical protein